MIIFWIILLIFVSLMLPTLSKYWQDRLDGKNKDKSLKSYFYEPPEQKYSKEIADGTLVVIKSELSTAKRCMFWIVCVVLITLLCFGLFHFLDYLKALAATCQQFLGLNSILIRDLIGYLLIPVPFSRMAWSDYRTYKSIQDSKEFYPSLSSKAKYLDVICQKVDSGLIGEKKRSFLTNTIIAIICFLLPSVYFHAPISKIFDANTIYNQKCEAKEYPFDRFHKKPE